ncbi:hypothetical protein HPB48_009774 [Haemaphysalis longicornis]|uniref:RNase H type-1 domain-containing protein n=1 Tax=Haemaphysalis longicornis TaxID=44386 RepID=A0A9J6GNK4_HAELO|nr:hypothetical protein HPB48_009774 [Haemaphysalis longicornis]
MYLSDYQFHIFTDGSESNDKVGAAFVVMNENLSMVDFCQYSLPKISDNFQAEVVALTKAIEYISSEECKKVQIITDSLSAVQAINNPYNENPMILEVKKTNRKQQG